MNADLKSALRREAKERRAKAAARAGEKFQKRLADRFFRAIEVKSGDVVGSYWAIGDEADPAAIEERLAAKGIALALPAMDGDKPLVFRRFQKGDELTDGQFGTREPAPSCPSVTPNIVIVPLLAFDKHGHRLGYGQGYYDRTLSALRAKGRIVAAGIAYAAQRVSKLPNEANDERLDLIVTEDEALDFRSMT